MGAITLIKKNWIKILLVLVPVGLVILTAMSLTYHFLYGKGKDLKRQTILQIKSQE